MGRVQIGTCTGPADAALVRAAFDAHDIPVLINAEQHASMLGGLGGAFVPLHIFVDEQHAEEAVALLADLREHDRHQDAVEAGAEVDPPEHEALDDDEPDPESAAHARERAARRQRNGILLTIVLGGAVATPYVIGNPMLSILLVVGCLGAMVLTLRTHREAAPLPRAQIKRRGKRRS